MTKEEIERKYRDEVKHAAANLANDILADPYRLDLDRHMHEFRCWVTSARSRREERLAELAAVKIERRHLQTLADEFVRVVGKLGPGYFTTGVPVCFATYYRTDACCDDQLCQACVAIGQVLHKGGDLG